MPTGRGWTIAVAAVAAMIAGRLLGLIDLFMAGAALAFLIAAALCYVRTTRLDILATRRVQPPRVHAGGSSRVELSIINRSDRPSPVLGVRDPFDGGARWARFRVAPLSPGELARGAYRLPTEQRGVFDLGPLGIRVSDPFGLVAQSTAVADRTRLTVYPQVDRIVPMPTTRGQDPLAGADHPHALAGGGDDFYGLRPYVMGDDLRRVHWPSTARTDDLMIRQDEMSWQGRATVVLDTRARTSNPEAFELAVSAAASIVSANWRHQSLLRLITTGDYDSGFASGHSHVESILEQLALAGSDQGSLLQVVANLHHRGGGGGLAVITTALAADDELQAIANLRSRYGTAALVLFEPSAWGSPPVPDRRVPLGTHLVRVRAGVPYASAWDAVFASARGRSRPSTDAPGQPSGRGRP
jgi:uncharacterized protein (DUF58 family)